MADETNGPPPEFDANAQPSDATTAALRMVIGRVSMLSLVCRLCTSMDVVAELASGRVICCDCGNAEPGLRNFSCRSVNLLVYDTQPRPPESNGHGAS